MKKWRFAMMLMVLVALTSGCAKGAPAPTSHGGEKVEILLLSHRGEPATMSERDYQYVFTNLTTALAADRVWFNSAYHRDSFLGELPGFLKKMPDYQPVEAVERVRGKSEVWWPGIEAWVMRESRRAGPMRILWAARWEHDKNPACFFEALKMLKEWGVEFRGAFSGGAGGVRLGAGIFCGAYRSVGVSAEQGCV